MKSAALLLFLLLLAGCGGGGDDSCAETSTLTAGPIALSAAMAPLATLDYRGAGGAVTLGGHFAVAGGDGLRVRLYDSFASTHYDVAVAAQDGMVDIPPFVWTPSTAPRTLVLYASSATPATTTQVKLLARECSR